MNNRYLFYNNKGGSAKTSILCGVLSAVLKMAEEGVAKGTIARPPKILCIDLDPQGNLSQTLLKEDDNVDGGVKDFLLGSKDFNAVVKEITFKSVELTCDLLPAHHAGLFLETELPLVYQQRAWQKVKEKLSKDNLTEEDLNSAEQLSQRFKHVLSGRIRQNNLDEIYDHIFIDCPPAVANLLTVALNATTKIVSGITPDLYSISGIANLRKIVRLANMNAVKRGYEVNLEMIVPAMIGHDNESEELIKILKTIFAEKVGPSWLKTVQVPRSAKKGEDLMSLNPNAPVVGSLQQSSRQMVNQLRLLEGL